MMRQAKSWIPSYLLRFSFEQLELFTDGFSESNFLGKVSSTHGKVFRGCMDGRPVIVERWDRVDETNDEVDQDINRIWQSQIQLLTTFKGGVSHVPALLGYCKQRPILGLVYKWECPFMNTMENMMLDGDFNWKFRIKAILQIARLLASLCPRSDFSLTVHGLEPACIMLDKNFNPVVFDLGVSHGAWLGEFSHSDWYGGRSAYVDLCYNYWSGVVGPYCDVYSLGALLVSLITKRNYSPCELKEWKTEAAKSKEGVSLPVHLDFLMEPEYHDQDGRDLVDLILFCLKFEVFQRPTIQKVVKCLESLQVIREEEKEGCCSSCRMIVQVEELLMRA